MIVINDYRGHQIVITIVAILALVLAACSSASPRRVYQPPVSSQYKGWTIRVTPSHLEDLWRADVRVWPPEARPETRPGIDVSFSGGSSDRSAVEQAATAAARRYIDASVPVHSQSSTAPAQIPEDQPPVMSEYNGWTISVTPVLMQDAWSARVQVWPPERRPEAHPGIGVSFNGTAAERSAVEQAATAAAQRYIDSSVSTR